MTSVIPYCFDCKHFIGIDPDNHSAKCKAFPGDYPDDIPDDILINRKKHDSVLPEQIGDYIFTPK
jgi:hypothetical protein